MILKKHLYIKKRIEERKWKIGKSKTRKSWKSQKSRKNYSKFYYSEFSILSNRQIENSDLKISENNFRDFQLFRVFDLALHRYVAKFNSYSFIYPMFLVSFNDFIFMFSSFNNFIQLLFFHSKI